MMFFDVHIGKQIKRLQRECTSRRRVKADTSLILKMGEKVHLQRNAVEL
jgi:hypothetical protein